jgi:hypothetical protein
MDKAGPGAAKSDADTGSERDSLIKAEISLIA